ncbi:MAG: glycosyltransferase [Flavobacteriales bacterium]|nr:glycosyltransferase [Flavobacteriales bacterium]
MRSLWLFTHHFPTGSMEISVGHELRSFCRVFDEVVVFPAYEREGLRPMPPNAAMRAVFHDPDKAASWLDTAMHAGLLRRVMREVKASAPSPAMYRLKRREIMARLRQALRRALLMRAALGSSYDPSRVALHSNWTDDQATTLALWKLMDPRVRFTARMRGFDMFAHRADGGWPPFQAFRMRSADRLYPVSEAGRIHLAERFPDLAHKLRTVHTGTADHGIAPWSPADALRIVSCSNLVPLKRVHLIAEALHEASIPVRWTHFGDGPERPALEAIIAGLPDHVRVELKGAVANQALIDHYRHHPVDLFVHMSSSEGGVAVVLQEAASFGIPLMAADAGGVSEIVNAHTGDLLPHDANASELMARMTAFHRRGHDPGRRDAARAFWKEHFESDTIHERFARELLEL